MITRKDAMEEMVTARKVIEDDKATVDKKIRAIAKVVEVTLKVVLSNRTNVVRLMEAKGVEKLEPRKKENAKTNPTTEQKDEETVTE